MGPWVIALVGALIIAAGLAIPIKGPGGISNSRDGGPAPRRSVPAIVTGFVVMAAGLAFTWQPWSHGDATQGGPVKSAQSADLSGVGTATRPASQTTPAAAPARTAATGTAPTPAAAPAARPWIEDRDFTLAKPTLIGPVSELDLSKPASGTKIDAGISALLYDNGKTLSSGDFGDVFGYAKTRPASAADCVAQGQANTITRLGAFDWPDGPYIKPGDAFCVSDKAGYVAWLRFVGSTPPDVYQAFDLHFKITVWKPGS